MQEIVNYLRHHSHSVTYGSSLPGPVAAQILTSMKIIMGEDGTNEGMSVIIGLLILREKYVHVCQSRAKI